jgi:hypothetical protein
MENNKDIFATKTAVELFKECIEFYIPEQYQEKFLNVYEECREIEIKQWDTQRIRGIIEQLNRKLY